MKKKMIAIAFMCMMAMGAQAQVYSYDTWSQLPVNDLYDTGMMNTHLGAMAATAARREAAFDYYCDQASEAYGRREWNYVIYYADKALNTQYCSGNIYFMRGFANEQLGNYRAAKRDYKKGKKHNSQLAARALEYLKDKMRRK